MRIKTIEIYKPEISSYSEKFIGPEVDRYRINKLPEDFPFFSIARKDQPVYNGKKYIYTGNYMVGYALAPLYISMKFKEFEKDLNFIKEMMNSKKDIEIIDLPITDEIEVDTCPYYKIMIMDSY